MKGSQLLSEEIGFLGNFSQVQKLRARSNKRVFAVRSWKFVGYFWVTADKDVENVGKTDLLSQ